MKNLTSFIKTKNLEENLGFVGEPEGNVKPLMDYGGGGGGI
ncbi:MAG: hypothetical protein ABEI74_00405 [Candidatus Pacearchaeota archaeon]